jgi:hypothetical protein
MSQAARKGGQPSDWNRLRAVFSCLLPFVGQVPFWIGFITGLDAGEGGGDAVGDTSRPFCPQPARAATETHITAIAAMVLAGPRPRITLDSLFCIERF